ncbi:alpha-hydroxy acid oxidase [Microtetraspora fusca]|uniref:alpha-hydroxy acid oxidase n=1 Tax=Microtetraspora fusca TaxID=1997 RepID=UPI00082D06C3|nr:alpha-hydroxy acid oxidase [Microtetraspora fusca]
MSRKSDRWTNLHDARAAARAALPRMVFDFVDGGAGDEVSARANLSAYADVRFAPRVLVDVSALRLETTVLGTPLSIPVVLGPTGMPALVHPSAERGAAAAAFEHGTAFTMSTTSSFSAAEVVKHTEGPLWFQLYAWKDRALTEEVIAQAREAGARALLFTVDTPTAGIRERDLRNGMTVPPRVNMRNAVDVLSHLGWGWRFRQGPGIRLGTISGLGAVPKTGALGVAGWFGHLFNRSQTWDDLEWIQDQWRGPIAVKGIMTPADARRAHELGAAAVVVSNHGGRQLDGVQATIEALPRVVDELVGTSTEVLIDGGVRRGADVVKALALGARAVLIGRPWLYGLAADGRHGVSAVLRMLTHEIQNTLELLGCADVNDLDRRFLAHPCRPGTGRNPG